MWQEKLFRIDVALNPTVEWQSRLEGELLMVLEGELTVELINKKVVLNRGDILYINNGERHALTSGDKDVLVFSCCISPGAQRGQAFYQCNSQETMDAKPFQEMRETIHGLLVEYYAGSEGEDFLRLSLCYRLLHLLDTYHKVHPEGIGQESRIQMICAYIEQNYVEKLTLQMLAEKFYLAPSYLSKIFKADLGENFVVYVNKVRMKHAVEELIATDHGITQIALQHGFGSAAGFYAQFSREYGIKPLEYRRLHKVKESKRNKDDHAEVKRRLGEHLNYIRPENMRPKGREIEIVADVNQGKVVRQNFLKLINMGDAQQIYRSDVRRALLEVRAEAGNVVRFWNIIPEEVYRGAEWRDFSLVDECMEFLRGNNLTPYIQFGSERKGVAGFLTEESIARFETPEQVISAAKQLIIHLSRSYPSGQSVIFELRKSYQGYEGEPAGINYIWVFREIRELLREYLPNSLMGGPGNSLRDYLNEGALDELTVDAVKPDFLAFSAFPYRTLSRELRLLADPDYLAKDLGQLKKLMDRRGIGDLPVYITEWNAFLASENYFQDSRWKACYTAKIYSDTLDKVDLIAHNQLFDERRETGDEVKPLFGGGGLIASNGLQKAAFSALKSLRTMGNTLLVQTDNAVITRGGKNRIRMILYNYKHFNYKYYTKKAQEILPESLKEYLEDTENQTIRIRFTGLEDGVYRIKHFGISEAQGSVLDEWVRKNCQVLRKSEILVLKNASEPDLSVYTVEAVGGQVELEFTLEPLDLISIDMVRDSV